MNTLQKCVTLVVLGGVLVACSQDDSTPRSRHSSHTSSESSASGEQPQDNQIGQGETNQAPSTSSEGASNGHDQLYLAVKSPLDKAHAAAQSEEKDPTADQLRDMGEDVKPEDAEHQ